MKPNDWFEMKDLRKRDLAANVWVPLRQSERLCEGPEWAPGYVEQVSLASSLAVFESKREVASRLSWSDIGLGHSPGHYAFPDGRYKPLKSIGGMMTSSSACTSC